MESTEDTIKRIERGLAIQERQLLSFKNCIEPYNYIVEIGAYTLGCDENGMSKCENTSTPTQWTKRAAEINAKTLRECYADIHIEIVDKITWYKEEIENRKMVIERLKTLL